MGGPLFNTTVEGVSASGNGVRGLNDAVFDPRFNNVGVYGGSKQLGVYGTGGSGGVGVFGDTDNDRGVVGRSKGSMARGGTGVFGECTEGIGVVGFTYTGIGVRGGAGRNLEFDPGIRSAGVVGGSNDGDGVVGSSTGSRSKSGVYAYSDIGYGLYASSGSNEGVVGVTSGRGVAGVIGFNTYTPQTPQDGGGYGVEGRSNSLPGVAGFTYRENSAGVYGEGSTLKAHGVVGFGYFGVIGAGFGEHQFGVMGFNKGSARGHGVGGYGGDYGIGVYGKGARGHAAWMDGKVRVKGYLYKDGGGFEIDHPLDPANKYLYHSFVESPDMKNVYDGVVVLDDKGEAEIELPDWFGAVNKDFRYQLTAIGAPGPNLYIAEEISSDGVTTTSYYYSNSSNNSNKNNNRFKIAGGAPGMKVSWQVTGIRKDPWANTHRIRVEEDKPDKERGYYIYPELYGQPEERGISHLLVPEIEKELPLLINDENKLPRRKIPF
jgi:hypothetical protein